MPWRRNPFHPFEGETRGLSQPAEFHVPRDWRPAIYVAVALIFLAGCWLVGRS